MKNQSNKCPDYIQKGYFVDVESVTRSFSQWEIVQIQETKVHLKNLRQQNQKLVFDINNSKIKPFRTLSKPTDNISQIHRYYCYWGDGIFWCLQKLKKVNNSANIYQQFSAVQMVQFLKGRNFYLIWSMIQSNKITVQNKQMVYQYIREFLKFFIKFWDLLNLNQFQNFDYKKLYENSRNALMMSWREIFIGLSVLFFRQSILQLPDSNIPKDHDKIMDEQLNWLNTQLVPAINSIPHQKYLAKQLTLKLILFFIKLFSLNRITRTNQNYNCLKKLISTAAQNLQYISLSKYQQLFKLINDIIQQCSKNQPQFEYIVLLKLHLTLAGQTIINQTVVTPLQKQTFLTKQLTFILYCGQLNNQGYNQFVWSFLKHQNGIIYLLKNIAFPGQSKQILRIFRFSPQIYLETAVRLKRVQLLKLPNQLWNAINLQWLASKFLSVSKNLQKQQLNFAKKIHQLLIFQTDSLNAQLSQKFNSQSADSTLIILIKQNLKILQQITDKMQVRIVRLCENLYEGQKTLIIQYVQRKILQKYVTKQSNNMYILMQQKQTNNFRQNLIYRRYLSKITNTNPLHFQQLHQPHQSPNQILIPIPNKSLILSIYDKLVNGMMSLKLKSQLQSRKQNIIFILNKSIIGLTSQFIDMLCMYIQNVAYVQNRQFKLKALESVGIFLQRVPFKSIEERIQGYKKIMDKFKIQSFGQFRVYMDLFKFVNQYQGNLKMADDLIIPIIIYQIPYGLQKIYQAFQSCLCDRIFLKKLVQFFNKIHLKIIQSNKKQFLLQQIITKLVNVLSIHKNNKKYIKIQNQQQYITEASQLIESFLCCVKDNSIQKQYVGLCNRMYGAGQSAANPTVIQQQNVQNLYNAQNKQNSTKIHKKYKLIVLLQGFQKQQDKLSNSNQIIQNDNYQYITQTQPNQILLKIKLKVCQFYFMPPISSTFSIHGQEIQYNNQNITIENLYESYCKKLQQQIKQQINIQMIQKNYVIQQKVNNQQPQSYNNNNNYIQNKELSQQNQQKQHSRQLEHQKQQIKPKQQQQLYFITLTIKQHNHHNFIKNTIMTKRNIIFNCLPYTIRIWQQLQITPQMWNTDPILSNIKQVFLSSYPKKYAENVNNNATDKQKEKQQNVEPNQWISIMNEPIKKQLILQALYFDPSLQKYNITWLFNTFTQSSTKNSFHNNYLSFLLIQKLQLKPTKQQLLKLLQKIQINQQQTRQQQTNQLQQQQSLYLKLIQQIFNYVKDNVQFCLFQYFMTIKFTFFQPIIDSGRFQVQFGNIWIHAFQKYLKNNSNNFLPKQMITYLNTNTQNFDYFIAIVQKTNCLYLTQNPNLQPFLYQWLQTSISLMIQNKKIIFQSQNLQIQKIRILLHLICCLLSKNIKLSAKMLTQQFIHLISSLMYSNLCSQIICIITFITNQCIKLGQQYIVYFQKQMYDHDLINKQYIKFNKSYQRHQSGYVGLQNPHSVCYINSLLQQLYHIKGFRQELFLTKWKTNDIVNQDLIYQLKKIFINLNLKQCQAYLNVNFFQAFKNDEGGPTSIEVQMDVDQFRGILFDRIQNLIIKPENQNRNIVQKYFNGKQITLVRCKQCGHQSQREQEFSSIILHVKGLKNLQNSLCHYFKPQLLSGDDKYFCDVCKTKVIAQRINIIKYYPKYLTFVLKRFQYVYQYKKKVNQRFQFPINQFEFTQNIKYKLKGVIVHQGLSQAGHYFSFIKLNDKWYEFNDNQVSEIYQQEVISQSFGESYARSNRNAYLLIYQRFQNQETITKKQQSHSMQYDQTQYIPRQFGLDNQIALIKKQNKLLWKAEIFLGEEFQNFIQTVVKMKAKNSISLLFQYITTIKSKCYRIDLRNLKGLFQLLDHYATSSLFFNTNHIEWALKFYKNQHFNHSFKAAMTEIIIKKQQSFHKNLQTFLKFCITSIHQELQTSVFYQIFYNLSCKFPEILKFLCDHRIIGRIYDISFPQILLTIERNSLAQTCTLPFPVLGSQKSPNKKTVQSSELRYHKWKLINLIIRSEIELNKIENTYIYSWSSRKTQYIYDQATTKANINQISKFFCHLSYKNQVFSDYYLMEVCEQISLQKSQNLRKYLKAAADLLQIKDQHQQKRAQKIKNTFAETFKILFKQKIMSSFDVKWQWFMKIVLRNKLFKDLVRSNTEQFKILQNKSNLQTLYLIRNQMNSQVKNKNKYYGLRFSSSTQSNANSNNNNYLQDKYELNQYIFNLNQNIIDEQKLDQIINKQIYSDTDLTDYPQIPLNTNTMINKYHDNSCRFKQACITDSLGDAIQINDVYYDRGDERFMHIFNTVQKFKAIKRIKEDPTISQKTEKKQE